MQYHFTCKGRADSPTKDAVEVVHADRLCIKFVSVPGIASFIFLVAVSHLVLGILSGLITPAFSLRLDCRL